MRKILVDFAIVTKAVRLRNLAARFQTIGATDPPSQSGRPIEIFRYTSPESSPVDPFDSGCAWLRSLAHGYGQNRAESGKSKRAKILRW
jgi:hypothetical protein